MGGVYLVGGGAGAGGEDEAGVVGGVEGGAGGPFAHGEGGEGGDVVAHGELEGVALAGGEAGGGEQVVHFHGHGLAGNGHREEVGAGGVLARCEDGGVAMQRGGAGVGADQGEDGLRRGQGDAGGEVEGGQLELHAFEGGRRGAELVAVGGDADGDLGQAVGEPEVDGAVGVGACLGGGGGHPVGGAQFVDVGLRAGQGEGGVGGGGFADGHVGLEGVLAFRPGEVGGGDGGAGGIGQGPGGGGGVGVVGGVGACVRGGRGGGACGVRGGVRHAEAVGADDEGVAGGFGVGAGGGAGGVLPLQGGVDDDGVRVAEVGTLPLLLVVTGGEGE